MPRQMPVPPPVTSAALPWSSPALKYRGGGTAIARRLHRLDFRGLDRFGKRQAAGELGRLQQTRDAVDRFERLDLLAPVRRLQLLEFSRLDQHVALERPD